MWKTQGCSLLNWQEGVKLGAVRERDRLYVSLEGPATWRGKLRFDYARHRRELNLQKNYVRLNEWPEWFTVDENTLYRVVDARGTESLRLGFELKEGIEVKAPARLMVERAGPQP
jgi:hypothetical protein